MIITALFIPVHKNIGCPILGMIKVTNVIFYLVMLIFLNDVVFQRYNVSIKYLAVFKDIMFQIFEADVRHSNKLGFVNETALSSLKLKGYS